VLSGIGWGLLVLALCRLQQPHAPWGPLVVTPFIGLIVGAVARPWIRTHIIWLAYGALLNLHLASALFGFTTCLYSWFAGQGIRGETFESALRGAWNAALTCSIGIDMSLLVFFLWPVAIANHFWLGYFTAESR
jgi:hypothetical protein